MKRKKDSQQILRDFGIRQSRQFLAISVTLVLLLLLALIYQRPDFIGEFSKNAILEAQIVVIIAFIGFSAFNWRCPSCNKYLGNNINRRICKHCGIRLR